MKDFIKIKNLLGDNYYNYLMNKHYDVMNKIMDDNHTDEFIKLMKNYKNLNFFSAFYTSIRVILLNNYGLKRETKNNSVKYSIPEGFTSMNFVIKNQIENFEDINNIYINHIFILPIDENIIDKIGVTNLLKFNNDTNYLSTEIQNGYSKYNFFFKFCSFILNKKDLEYKIPSYDKFLDLFHDYIIYLKENKEPTVYLNYKDFPDYFKNKYPDLFINEDIPTDIKVRFYLGKLTLASIEKDVNVLEILKNKNIESVFTDVINIKHNYSTINFIKYYSDKFGKNALVELISSFGHLLNLLNNKELDITLPKKIMDKYIRSVIYNELKHDEVRYDFIVKSTSYSAKKFKEEYSSLFLDESLPEDLRENFYEGLSFRYISNNRRYLKYIKEKDYITSLIKCEDISTIKFFDILKEDAFRIILNNPDTISKSLKEGILDQLCLWYIKTNRSFIPDYSIIKNFPTNSINNFINNKNKWKALLKSSTFNKEENRESLLKLAYVFGVFNYDDSGFKRLHELIIDIPKKLDKNNSFFIKMIKKFDNDNTKNLSISEAKILKIKKSFIKEGLIINKEYFIDNVYRENDDGTYTLMINMQEYPKSTLLLRELMEEHELEGILTPITCNDLFYDFKMEYNEEFKEIFSNNIEKIIRDDNYRYYITRIQRKFNEIKRFNCNRKINLDIALDYVKNNSLENVDVGNELLADHMSKIGYKQDKFDIIQKIYNVGKKRVFSSIPRIKNKYEEYEYEIVRMDDILPLEVGVLTNCCQKLDALGESCMIHSMIDKNGRLFIIKDSEGNLISQSWVWRNKGVLCFDNIEIPKAVMVKNGYNPLFIDRKLRSDFGDKILKVYIEAAKDLYKTDNESYKILLEKGIINKKQFDGLRLKKITIGKGFSSIIGSLDYFLKKDYICESPLVFINTATGDNSLYIRDSNEQYIVIDEEINSPNLENIYPYIDDYRIYDESSLSKIDIYKIKREELAYNNYEKSNFINYGMTGESFINDLKNYYESDSIKIMMNSVFTIIYEETDTSIIINDCFYDKNLEEKIIIPILSNAINQLKYKTVVNIPEIITKKYENREKTNKLLELKL